MSCLLWPAKTGTFFETKSKPKLWPRIDLAKIMAPMDSASRLVIGRWVISFNNWGQSHLTSWECFLWAFVEFFSFLFSLERLFLWWGKLVTRRPYPVILASLLLTAIASLGFLNFRSVLFLSFSFYASPSISWQWALFAKDWGSPNS